MRLALGIAAGGLIATLGSCSLLAVSEQCASDRDCEAKGGSFVGTTCSAGLCVTSANVVDGGSDTGVPVDQCTTTASCVTANGPHSVCLSGVGRRCATLTSKDCTRVIGPEERDNPLVIGLLVDTTQEAAAGVIDGASLALNDFQQALAGVPGAQGVPPRPLLLVVCAEQSDPIRATRHLVETLSVPAIIGPTSSERLLDVAEEVTLASRTLLVSPSAGSARISTLRDRGLVFRTAPSDALEGKVMALLAGELASATGGNARAVTISTDSDRGDGLTTGIEASLSLNGKSTAQAKEDGDYVALSLAQTPSGSVLESVAKDAAAKLPHVVLLAGDEEQAALIPAIEAAWPVASASMPPIYVLAANVPSAALLETLRTAPDTLLSRIHVVFPSNERSAVYLAFQRLLASSATQMPPFFEAAKAYDALYTVALSAVPLLGQRAGRVVTGREMGDAISSFLARGDRAEVGALSLPGVAARLNGQTVVDLEGASGPLDFDNQGDVETNMELGCLRRGADGLIGLAATESYYRAGTNAVAGVLQGVVGPCR